MTESPTSDSEDLRDTNMPGSQPTPVHAWHTTSTAESIALRVAADSPIAPNRVYTFALEPEQARQLIRDLSAAVLDSDVRRMATTSAEKS